jgi:ubiquinone/menaquinone biosynthesis C-methylase UbiE
MSTNEIKFTDGAAYERYMGVWSRMVGDAFLEWLKPGPGLRWLDVGCGNGAFTERLAELCAPASLHGIDPSEPQLEFARSRPLLRSAVFRKADALDLPFPAHDFDAAVMPLVIFFVPDPAKGVAEMARVVVPGGIVSAYAWDMPGGGFPYAMLMEELRALGFDPPRTPFPEASRLETLAELWNGARLESIETRVFTAQRTYSGFEDYWTTVLGAPSMGPTLAAMSAAETAALRERLRIRLGAKESDPITVSARCHAIKGKVSR